MKTWKLALCLAAIFAAGVLSGGLVIGKLAARRMAFRGGPPGGALATLWVEGLRKRIDLTPEQTRQITPIVSAATDDFIKAVTTEVRTGANATNLRILPLLTPAQREKFLQFTKEQEEMIDRLSQGKPPAPPLKP